jgi:hypothetical protein
MKVYWGMEEQLYAFLTSALDVGEWSALPSGRFTPVNEPLVPIGQEGMWAPVPVRTRW